MDLTTDQLNVLKKLIDYGYVHNVDKYTFNTSAKDFNFTLSFNDEVIKIDKENKLISVDIVNLMKLNKYDDFIAFLDIVKNAYDTSPDIVDYIGLVKKYNDRIIKKRSTYVKRRTNNDYGISLGDGYYRTDWGYIYRDNTWK